MPTQTSKFDRIRHCESSGLPGFESALEGWQEAMTLYAQAAQGDYSWNYRERPCVGFLAAGIWRSGGVALEEWSTSKYREFDKHQGRCDLWAFHARRYDYHVEAKHMWSRATGIRVKELGYIEDMLSEAASEAYRIDCEGERIGILFLAPYYPKGKQNNLGVHIAEWLKDISKIPHDAIAWQFRDHAKLEPTEENLLAGIVLLARKAHAKKKS